MVMRAQPRPPIAVTSRELDLSQQQMTERSFNLMLSLLVSLDPREGFAFIEREGMGKLNTIKRGIEDKIVERISVSPKLVLQLMRALPRIKECISMADGGASLIDDFYYGFTYVVSADVLQEIYSNAITVEVRLDFESRNRALISIAERKSAPDPVLDALAKMTTDAPWLACEDISHDKKAGVIEKIRITAQRTVNTKETTKEVAAILVSVRFLSDNNAINFMRANAIPALNRIAQEIKVRDSRPINPENYTNLSGCLYKISYMYSNSNDQSTTDTLETFASSLVNVLQSHALRYSVNYIVHSRIPMPSKLEKRILLAAVHCRQISGGVLRMLSLREGIDREVALDASSALAMRDDAKKRLNIR
ncbi:MAG: hypothetical protein ACHQX1_00075 [Candidatus Micrarchaeales archaeon]